MLCGTWPGQLKKESRLHIPNTPFDPSTALPEVEFIEVEVGSEPRYSVIWLHGLGADGHDFEPIVPALGLPDSFPVRFLFPHAPERPITVNGGIEMRGWYDIREWSLNRNEDEEGLEQSRQIVHALIEQENRRGIPSDRIFLAGFSQGGAVALFTGLRYPRRLAGIIALSCYLPVADRTAAERSPNNQFTAIFMGHGRDDQTVPYMVAELSKDRLLKMDDNINWKTYPMMHAVHPQEVADISGFLQAG